MTNPVVLQKGDTAPAFCLKNQDEKEVCLSDFKGKWVVFYFYPKDNTPGCTIEAIDFTGLKADLENKNTIILGVSNDSCQSHRNFIEKQNLGIMLLSDPGRETMEKYGVLGLKKNYGKEYMGVIRSTFLIDPEGKIARAWYKVNAKGHAANVSQAISELQN